MDYMPCVGGLWMSGADPARTVPAHVSMAVVLCSKCYMPPTAHEKIAVRPYILELPIPPSLNIYYKNAKRKVRSGPSAGKEYNGKMISEEGIRFRSEVIALARRGHRAPPKLSGRLSVLVYYCKSKRTAAGSVRNVRSDGDNLWKCLLDALTHAGVVADDSLFDDHRMIRGNQIERGRCWVSISRADPDAALRAVRAAGIDPTPQVFGELPF
jgi:crossover junction endodeoxyribonuclease RusA